MERQLDEAAGLLLQRASTSAASRSSPTRQTEEILGADRVDGVRSPMAARSRPTWWSMAVGVRPNIDLAEPGGPGCATAASSSTTRCGPATTRRSTPSANASSTAARSSAWWRRSGSRRGLRAPARGEADARLRARRHCHQLKITGIDLFSAGRASRGGRCRQRDHAARPAPRRLQKAGAARRTSWSAPCCSAMSRDGPWYVDLMRAAQDIDADPRPAVFGRASRMREARFPEAGPGPHAEPYVEAA